MAGVSLHSVECPLSSPVDLFLNFCEVQQQQLWGTEARKFGYGLETGNLRLHPNSNPNVTSWPCGPRLTTTNRGRCKRRVPVSKP